MKGLLIKDLLNLRKSLSTVIVLILFYAFLGYQNDDPSILIAMIVMVMTMMSVTSIAYDDLAKWDNLALAMPIGRKSIVLSKYVLAILLSISGVIISTIIAYFIYLIKGEAVTNDLFMISYIIFIVSMIFTSIVLPLIYKFGVERSRLMMMAVIALPMAIGYLLVNSGVALPTESQFIIILRISPIIALLFIFLSFGISYRLFSTGKK